MDRRAFLSAVAGSLLAVPLAAEVQQAQRVRRVGLLENVVEGDPDTLNMISSFRQRMHALGGSDGLDVRVEVRWSGGSADRLPALAAELVALQSDVMFGRSTPVVAALRRASAAVPIV